MTQPEKSFRQGACSASIFANEIEKNGKPILMPKVSIQRRYKDKSGKWQSTNSYGINDLPKLIVAASKAYDYLTTKEDAE